RPARLHTRRKTAPIGRLSHRGSSASEAPRHAHSLPSTPVGDWGRAGSGPWTEARQNRRARAGQTDSGGGERSVFSWLGHDKPFDERPSETGGTLSSPCPPLNPREKTCRRMP